MTKKQAKLIMRYFIAGFIVIIDDNQYVKSPVTEMFKNENGDILFSDNSTSERRLETVNLVYVFVAKPILNLQESDLENDLYIEEQGNQQVISVEGEEV